MFNCLLNENLSEIIIPICLTGLEELLVEVSTEWSRIIMTSTSHISPIGLLPWHFLRLVVRVCIETELLMLLSF